MVDLSVLCHMYLKKYLRYTYETLLTLINIWRCTPGGLFVFLVNPIHAGTVLTRSYLCCWKSRRPCKHVSVYAIVTNAIAWNKSAVFDQVHSETNNWYMKMLAVALELLQFTPIHYHRGNYRDMLGFVVFYWQTNAWLCRLLRNRYLSRHYNGQFSYNSFLQD